MSRDSSTSNPEQIQVVILRNGVRIIVPLEVKNRIDAVLSGLKAGESTFIGIEGQTVNTADITCIIDALDDPKE